MSITGTIGVLQPHIPIDLKLTAKNAQPIASNIITANLDADIHVSGTAREQLDVDGKLRVNRANIEIPSGFPPDVAVLDVRRPGKATAAKAREAVGRESEGHRGCASPDSRKRPRPGRGTRRRDPDPRHFRCTRPSAATSSCNAAPSRSAAASLTFSYGTVTFNGAGLKKKIDPTLDFIASTQVVDVTATVKITGLADAPKIELSSTPDLPQDEIMARLLFGESASQLSALQVVQIGAALASLGGGGGGLNPLTKIQKTLGLDRLTVGSGTTTGTGTGATQQNSGYSVEAGRYVSSRVFVAVKESTTGTSQLAVDVDLTKHLKLQTRLGNGSTTAQGTTPENDPGSSIGLAYQFEY